MKKKIICIVIFVILLSLSSCSKTSSTSAADSYQDSIPESIQKDLSDNAQIDATVSVGADINSIYKGSGINYTFTENNILNCFPEAKSYDKQTGLGNKGSGICYSLSDQINITADSGMISYYKTNSALTNSVVHLFRNNIHSEPYNADDFMTNEDFSFLSRKDAILEVKNYLQKMGISEKFDMDVYSLPYANLKKWDDKFTELYGKYDSNQAMISNWDESCNSYYIEGYLNYNGLQILSTSHGDDSKGSQMVGTELKAIITKDGLTFLVCSNIIKIDSTSESCKIINLESAINKFAQKYTNLLGSNKYTVKKITLNYYLKYSDSSHTKIDIIPCWSFYVESTIANKDNTSEDITDRFYQDFDAIDGSDLNA